MKFFYTLLVLSGISFASELTAMQSACDRGVAEACHDLGLVYNGSNGLEADIEKEKDYLTQGCDLDSDRACEELEKTEMKLRNNDE